MRYRRIFLCSDVQETHQIVDVRSNLGDAGELLRWRHENEFAVNINEPPEPHSHTDKDGGIDEEISSGEGII